MTSWISICLGILTFLLEDVGSYEYSCSCRLPPHPQGDYCHSSFAIRGIVQHIRIVHKDEDDSDSNMNEPDIYHTIRIKEDFKNIPEELMDWYGNDRAITLETFISPMMCGAGYLTVGQEYLLTGQIFLDRFAMSSCDTHALWSSIDADLKQKWEQGFKCDDCAIASSFYNTDPEEVCFFDEEDAWLYEESNCLKNDENLCEWTDSS